MEKYTKEEKSIRDIHFDNFLEFLIVAAFNTLAALWITAGVSLSYMEGSEPDWVRLCG